MLKDELYMNRCLQLASNGCGNVSPNPMVGAVLVCEGRIIGEGFHACLGQQHAEVHAIRSVRDESLLQKATLYVSLEPCSHYGKTPPCAELIVQKQIPRVVIAALDPFPQVAGRGVKRLIEAGVDVKVGVLEEEAKALNAPFYYTQLNDSPCVTLKWAQSVDGFMDKVRTSDAQPPVAFSTPETRRMVHKLRAASDAIMVGTNTYLLDRPSLSTRYWAGRSPLRVIVDRTLRIPPAQLTAHASANTLVYTEQEQPNRDGVEFVQIPFDGNELALILRDLKTRGVQSLLVEGGATLLQSFVDQHLWNRIRVETSPKALFAGVKSPSIGNIKGRVSRISIYGKNLVTCYEQAGQPACREEGSKSE